MTLPFTTDQFLDVFRQYNVHVWPMQQVLVLLAAGAVFLAARPDKFSDRVISGVLALLWLWMGVAYHLAHFTAINKGAYVFGAAFIVQGGLFVIAGVIRGRLAFRFGPNVRGAIGALFVLYALVIYPILGRVFGHVHPASPTFGLPCPTVIFTFGLLTWSWRRVPMWLLVIPALWSLVGFSAALTLGITQDFGLLVAGVVGTVTIVCRNRRLRPV